MITDLEALSSGLTELITSMEGDRKTTAAAAGKDSSYSFVSHRQRPEHWDP